MRKNFIFKTLTSVLTAALAFSAISSRAQNVNVVSTLNYVQGNGGVFHYTLTLSNSGPESIKSLWVGWIPGVFDISNPANPTNNLGWTSSTDGNSLQYLGGTALASASVGIFTFDSTSTPAQFMSHAAGDSTAYGVNAANGQLSFELSGADTETFNPTVASSPTPTPPTITTQPQDQSVYTNTTVMFTVVASNALSYQWQSNTIPLAGQTNTSLTLNNVVIADSATYRVVVSNASSSVTSSNAVLVVSATPVPTILTQPQSQIVLTNATVQFSVIASNATFYQWESNTVAIPGATNDSLTLSNVVIADSATYQVIVSNAFQSVISSNAVLQVVTVPLPTILTQPQSQLAVTNTTVMLSVTASNAVSYQWQTNLADLEGATNASLTLSNVVIGQSGSYQLIVSSSSGSVTSSVAVLLVGFPVTFSQQLTNVTVSAGTPVTLQVAATASPAPQYQWFLNTAKIAGQTNPTLSFEAATTNLNGTYSIVVSNTFGAQASSNAVLTVEPLTTVTKQKLQVVINPAKAGTVSPSENGKSLDVSHSYTVSAVAAKGWAFANWTGVAQSADPTVTFIMPSISNATLTANFIPSPFTNNSVGGAYAGIFLDTNNPSNETSGYFSATIGNGGVMDGTLKIAGASATFATTLLADGSATLEVKRHNLSSLVLTVQVDLSGLELLTGTVADASNTFNAQLTARRAGFSATHTAADFAGSYTFAMQGAATNAPAGFSYGTATITGAGSVRLGIFLSDGTSATASGSLSTNGQVPLYVSLYSGKGSFLSWLSFTNSSTVSATNSAYWLKDHVAKAPYANGFTMTNLPLLTGLYTAEARGTNAFDVSEVTVQISDGDLTNAITNVISLKATGIGGSSTNTAINIAGKTGLFSGSFKDPAYHKTVQFKGAVLRPAAAAYGFFNSGGLSGAVVIEPQ